jgi:SAM-dependent methyltransferase
VADGFDQAAGQYDATGTEFFTGLAQRLVELAGIRPGARVVDLGCGKGPATIAAARAAGPDGHVDGIDTSPAMLEYARAAARDAALANITWRNADAKDPPFPDASADVVVASSVIQFLDDPRRAARNWLRLLAPGGTLAVSWGIAQDPAWVPVMAVLDAAVPEPFPGFETFLRRPPFDAPGALEGMLSGCGYTGIVTHAESVTTVYDSPERWWAAAQGQAPWVVSWKHIPAPVLEAARAEAFRLLAGLRGPDGRLTRTLRFGYTLARPGKPSVTSSALRC